MERKGFIGSSDIAAIMGLSRWCTPLQLWAIKTGKVQPDDLSEVEHVELGTELEDFVAQKFQRKTGLKVRRAAQIYKHDEFPYYCAQVDRLIEGTDELLECKTCSAWKAKEWDGEEIPQEYILQVMWQLGISGRSVGHIAVLIGGQAFRYKKIEFDLKMFEQMLFQAGEFWWMVENDSPPMTMGDDNDFMVELYPTSDQKIQEVEELNDKIALLQQTKGSIADFEKTKDEIEAEIKAVIGETLGIKTKEYLVTWKRQEGKRIDVDKLKEDKLYDQYLKSSETRVLRVRKQGEKNVDNRIS